MGRRLGPPTIMARILLVDDEPVVHRTLASYLRRCGHEVRVAKNGLEAIAALGEAPADVVVTDINMPDMDGIEMVIALQETAPEVPVIAMSGGGLFETGLLLDSAAALGAFRTLEKPFDPSELRDAIDAALGEASGGTEGG